jgi:AcrR family transcriptional regulator
MMEYENSTKKRIREVALKLFNEKTFEKVTLNEICAASGVNKHTFYYYFKSKDELLKDYYEIPSKVTPYDLTTILTADSYVEQLWLLNKNFLDFIENSGISIIKQLIIKNLKDDVGTFKISEEKKEMLKVECEVIRKGQENGEFLNKANPEALVVLLKQITHSMVVTWSLGNASFDYKTAVRYMYETMLDVAPQLKKVKDFNILEIL